MITTEARPSFLFRGQVCETGGVATSVPVDLTRFAGQWIAQRPDAEVVASADTLPALEDNLGRMGIDVHDVGITEVPEEGVILLL